jgi:GrpB-like predicted nucleotidyltransferase (UPF0157 family)
MGFTTPGCEAGFCTVAACQRPGAQSACCPGQYLLTRNQLLLRDYLRQHPDDAARYGALKKRLAALDDNGDDYTRTKTELIQELTDKARAERGLPPAPVWEE